MRPGADSIWDTWSAGGPFIGETRANGRVTVEWAWHLYEEFNDVGTWPVEKRPVRWFQHCTEETFAADPTQPGQVEIPHVRTISIDKSIDSDADTCTIVVLNQEMRHNLGPQPDLDEFGQPGYYSMGRGLDPDATARWKAHSLNSWAYALTPNTMLRTYEGFGGEDVDIPTAMTQGNLSKTGTWLVDRVRISHDGLITLECRNMAKLLIEQQLFPPLVPREIYPLRYQRWKWSNQQVVTSVPGAAAGNRRCVFEASTVDIWYPGGGVGSGNPGDDIPNGGFLLHGHRAIDSLDGNPDTFALSVGNSNPEAVWCADWWQYSCGESMDTVYLTPWCGDYTMYVSIDEGAGWLDESGEGTILHSVDPLYGTQPYVRDSGADIPFVAKFTVPWEVAGSYVLPRQYNAQSVRITFRDHTRSQWGPWYYRCGIREVSFGAGNVPPTQTVENVVVKEEGNYKDYTDIIRDLLLWSGFFCKEDNVTGVPGVMGNLETTGAWLEEGPLPDDMFDKRPVIDAITRIKEAVGYIFWVDEDGGARFETPNWWEAGNFTQDGFHLDFIPDIDEKTQLTGYSTLSADQNLRSQIIISTSDPMPVGGTPVSDIVTTYYTPATANILRGMKVPFMWWNGKFTSREEQEIMAELIAMHIWFRMRQGSVSMWGNPLLQINDQVRIWERVTGETFIHYVRGIQSEMDNESGSYTMNLTTHWLGNDEHWVVKK